MGDAIASVVKLVSSNFNPASFFLSLAFNALTSSLFKPKAPKAEKQDLKHSVRQPLTYKRIIYGETRVGGTIVFLAVSDNNKYLHLVVAFAAHEVQSFEKFYFDENELTLTGNAVTGSSGDPSSRFTNYAWIYPHTGNDLQSADSDLIAASVGWSSSHKLSGIAYAYVKLKHSQKAFANGIPNITALIKGKKVYDPRTALTAYSNNAALCAADYLMDTRLGLGIPQSRIDMTVLDAAADTCDESVSLNPSGTESRYTCNGAIEINTSPKSIIEQLATAKAAPTVSAMGVWYVFAGAYNTPTISLSESDMAGPISVLTRTPRADLFNSVKGVYSSPDNKYTPSDYPVVQSATAIAEDNDIEIFKDVDLPFTSSPATAQRIAKIELSRARRQITCKAKFKIKALDIIPFDTVQLSNDRMGWSSKTFEVTDWRLTIGDVPGMAVELSLRETDSAVYTWSTADQSIANAAPTTYLPNPYVVGAPTGIYLSSDQIATGAGDETYKVSIHWTAPADEFVTEGGMIEIQYRVNGTTDWQPSWFVAGDQVMAEIYMLEVGVSYDARIRATNGIAVSNWQTITNFTVTSPGGALSTLDYGEASDSVGASLDYGEASDSVGSTLDYGEAA